MQTSEQRKEWLSKNRHKMSEYQKKYRQNDSYKKSELNRHLLRKYGITVDEKQKLWNHQKGLCAVCHKDLPDIYERNCQVDHCHDSNTVRGLLHWYCNIMVGVYENYPNLIENITNYLSDAIVRTQDKNNSEKLAEMTNSGENL